MTGRLVAIRRAGNPRSAQRIVPGAEHHFRDMDEVLVDAVAEWLAAVIGGRRRMNMSRRELRIVAWNLSPKERATTKLNIARDSP